MQVPLHMWPTCQPPGLVGWLTCVQSVAAVVAPISHLDPHWQRPWTHSSKLQWCCAGASHVQLHIHGRHACSAAATAAGGVAGHMTEHTPDTPGSPHTPRCTEALTSGGSKLQVDSVILPDGEEHKSMEVLMQVGCRPMWLINVPLLVYAGGVPQGQWLEGVAAPAAVPIRVVVAAAAAAATVALVSSVATTAAAATAGVATCLLLTTIHSNSAPALTPQPPAPHLSPRHHPPPTPTHPPSLPPLPAGVGQGAVLPAGPRRHLPGPGRRSDRGHDRLCRRLLPARRGLCAGGCGWVGGLGGGGRAGGLVCAGWWLGVVRWRRGGACAGSRGVQRLAYCALCCTVVTLCASGCAGCLTMVPLLHLPPLPPPLPPSSLRSLPQLCPKWIPPWAAKQA